MRTQSSQRSRCDSDHTRNFCMAASVLGFRILAGRRESTAATGQDRRGTGRRSNARITHRPPFEAERRARPVALPRYPACPFRGLETALLQRGAEFLHERLRVCGVRAVAGLTDLREAGAAVLID